MRPNLTGVWNLVATESVFGFLRPPASRLDTIVHDGEHLHIRTRISARGKGMQMVTLRWTAT